VIIPWAVAQVAAPWMWIIEPRGGGLEKSRGI
jgi:hypothetical protein